MPEDTRLLERSQLGAAARKPTKKKCLDLTRLKSPPHLRLGCHFSSVASSQLQVRPSTTPEGVGRYRIRARFKDSDHDEQCGLCRTPEESRSNHARDVGRRRRPRGLRQPAPRRAQEVARAYARGERASERASESLDISFSLSPHDTLARSKSRPPINHVTHSRGGVGECLPSNLIILVCTFHGTELNCTVCVPLFDGVEALRRHTYVLCCWKKNGLHLRPFLDSKKKKVS